MTPAQALSLLRKGDPEKLVPALYRHMHGDTLRALVEECAKATPPGLEEAEPQHVELQSTGPMSGSVPDLLQRAIARPERLRTPARRRAAFLRHYAACRTLLEAAARTGIDRRTVTRWRTAFPSFDQHLHRLAIERREDAFEQAMLLASRPRIRPVFYRGKKVGEYEIPNNALALYLLKRADAEADRAEAKRAEKSGRSAPPEDHDNGETDEEALDRVARLRRGEWPAKVEPDSRDMSHPPGHREMSHSSGHREMSHSPGHSRHPFEQAPTLAAIE